MTERLFDIAKEEIKQEIDTNIKTGQGHAEKIRQRAEGMIRQLGRLTDESGIQYVFEPTISGGFVVIPTRTPGQLSRMKFRFSSLSSITSGFY